MEKFQACTKCKVIKQLSSFSNNCNMINGKMTQCKQFISSIINARKIYLELKKTSKC
jgi:hypothetical protein